MEQSIGIGHRVTKFICQKRWQEWEIESLKVNIETKHNETMQEVQRGFQGDVYRKHSASVYHCQASACGPGRAVCSPALSWEGKLIRERGRGGTTWDLVGIAACERH